MNAEREEVNYLRKLLIINSTNNNVLVYSHFKTFKTKKI